eukprot:SAG31_NODE_476_length_15154_cov_24.796878_13_plen_68_part_00
MTLCLGYTAVYGVLQLYGGRELVATNTISGYAITGVGWPSGWCAILAPLVLEWCARASCLSPFMSSL